MIFSGRSLTAAITFLPPLGFALSTPAFITAQVGAAIALVIRHLFTCSHGVDTAPDARCGQYADGISGRGRQVCL